MDKTAIVTGAASGIGHYCAMKLIEEGFRIIAIDKKTINLPKPAIIIQRDLTDLTGCELPGLGTIDYAINCAGVPSQRKELLEFSAQEIVDSWQENFLPCFNAMQLALKAMKTQRHGKIINIASSTAHVGMKNMLAYSTAKAAIVNMTKVAAIEYANFNIQINSISPASIDTPMLRDKYQGVLPDYSEVFYTSSCGVPQDVFSVVKMFMENDFITGYDLVIDGGLSNLCQISPR